MKGNESRMEIKQERKGESLTLCIEGRIDTKTAPQLESALTESLDGVTDLTFDLKNVPYMSSAGLRVLLLAQKQMNTKGQMKVIHASASLIEIFEITGFSDILTIVSGEEELSS